LISFAYLLILTIPLPLGIKLTEGSTKSEHLWQGEQRRFTFKVEKGSSYAVTISPGTFPNTDFLLYVFDGPYGVIGKAINDGGTGQGENYIFQATKTGRMTIVVKRIGGTGASGYFSARYDEVVPTSYTNAKLSIRPGAFIGIIFPTLVFAFFAFLLVVSDREIKRSLIRKENNMLLKIVSIEEVLTKRNHDLTESDIESLVINYSEVKKFYNRLNLDESEKISEKLTEIHEKLGLFLLDIAEHLLEKGDFVKAELRVFDAEVCYYESPRIDELKHQIQVIRQTRTSRKRIENLKELNKQRKEEFKKIINRYTTIDLVEMAELLNFTDKIALQEWLMSLPEEDEFLIEDDLVILPKGLKNDSRKTEKIVDSMEYFKHKTCYWCGYPISSNDNICVECGKKIPICAVCKLPISFGDKIGKCPHCDAHGHLVHLQEWSKTQGKCPHCRKKLPLEAIINISQPEKKER